MPYIEDNILEIKNLSAGVHVSRYEKMHGAEKWEIPIIERVNLKVPRGKIVGVVGESGCGKSMTVKSIMGLLRPPVRIQSGEILFEGKDLLKLSPKEMCKLRGNEISMIFQEPMTALNPVQTVGRQVREAVLTHEHISKKDAKNRALDILGQVGIGDAERRYKAYPHQLSGGLRQRVMIGMAMACQPQILLADEPTTALDVTVEAQILNLMKSLQEKNNMSIILITHNIGVIAQMCDYVYVMYAGEVVESASVYDLFENPRHPYTRGLLESVPKIDGDAKRLPSIPGTVPDIHNLPQGCRFCTRCKYVDETCKNEKPEQTGAGDLHFVRCFREQ